MSGMHSTERGSIEASCVAEDPAVVHAAKPKIYLSEESMGLRYAVCMHWWERVLPLVNRQNP